MLAMQIQFGAVETLGDETPRLQQGSNAAQRVVSEPPYFNGFDVGAQTTRNDDGVAEFDQEPDEHTPRRDALPEHTTYRDTDCELNPTCLDCPLAQCRYDGPSRYRPDVAARRERVLTMRREGKTVTAVAEALGMSRRNVFRLSVLAS